MKTIELEFLDRCLLHSDDDGNVYSGHTYFGSRPMHIELIAVDEEGDALDSAYQGRIDAVKDFDDGHGVAYELVPVGDKQYFLIVHPFQK